MSKKRFYGVGLVVLLLLLAAFGVNANSSADNPFLMQDGLLTVEVESAPLADDWVIGTALTGASGQYYHWDTESRSRNGGEGTLAYYVSVPEAGLYRFQLRSARGPIDDNTEQNDAFVRVQGVGSSAIAIKASNGNQVTMGNEWFKLYQNQRDQDWTWTSHHVDNNAHQIFFQFDAPGVYTVSLSGRSEKFNIDRWVLYDESRYSGNDATDLSNPPSPQGTPPDNPTPTNTPEPTPTPMGDAPEAPASFAVDPNNGRPVITWPEDPQAEWFNLWMIGQNGTQPLADAWFPLAQVNCQNGTCSLAPNVYPTGGTYTVWLRSWGNGQFSTGGNSQYDGWSSTTFSLPTERPAAPTGLNVTGDVTLTWTGQPFVTWYQIWIGTADDLTAQHFEPWALASAYGCANAGVCSFTPDVSLSAGAYVVWMQTWGPGGFNQSALDSGWVEVGTFTIP